ncbi:MAG: IPT/TIG domain-containing protein [Candidatus Melainabacteria bacterium]|nr:IPT/TIG domain-containing protein [Candidatus Melainabacteria bacterium]
MSLENSPVSRAKHNAVIKLHCLLTAVSFSFALLPSSLIASSSPAHAQPITIVSENFKPDTAEILIAAKSADEVKAPNSAEVNADSEDSEGNDKEKKSDNKKSEDKKSKAKDTKASAKDEKAKADKTKDDKSKAKDDKSKAEKSKDDKVKDKKADAKEDSKKDDSKDDKKKATIKRGFFGRAKEDTTKAPAVAIPAATPAIAAPPAATTAVTTPAKASEKKEETEDKSLVFEPDTALISVLKDLNRALKDSEEISKIEDANQRMIVTLAAAVIDKALSDPKLAFNRILAKEQEGKARTRLTAESWSSGDVEVNGKFKGSLSTVWAKRIDGLVTVTVAGDCHDRKAADGKDIGEFIVVINARSPVETGFDIQSQANVNFWIGKLGTILVEADCIPKPAAEGEQPAERKGDSETQSSADQKKKSIAALPPLLTHRYRHYYELVVLQDDRRRLIAQQLAMMDPSVQMQESEKEKTESEKSVKNNSEKATAEKDKKEIVAKVEKTKVAAETKPKADAESDDQETENKPESKPKTQTDSKTISKSISNEEKAQKEEVDEETTERAEEKSATTEKVVKAAAPSKKEPEVKVIEKFVERAPEKTTEKPSRVETVYNTGSAGSYPVTITTSNTNLKTAAGKSTRPVAKQDNNSSATTTVRQGNEMAYAGAAQSMERITGLELPALKQPKNFTLLMPERALAGQPVTVAFVDEQRNPESNVELSFNGVTLSTDQNGQAQYMIPEDETPGRSLNISLLSRPYEMPAVIEVLQPLATPSSPQAPKVDKASHLVSRRSNLVIDGHNFDGVAQNNRVIIDGMTECTIAAASPVQLKVTLPKDLRPGAHSLCVSTEGMRSNPIGFELAQLEVVCEGKDNPKDTSGKVTVKVVGTTTKVNVKLVNLSPDLIKLNKGDDVKLLSSGGAVNTASVSVQRLKKGPMKVEAWLEL